MNHDLTPLLKEWPYQSGQVSARVIVGEDGEHHLQVRLDLGILQMMLDGRPDGQEPFGSPSLLDHFELSRETGHEEAEAESIGEETRFSLSAEECRLLREEMAQFNQRALALLALEDYERAARDATRNLRVIDFCKQNAENEDDRTILEQYRAYVVMMRSRALASQALKDNEPKSAVLALDEGLDSMKHHFTDSGKPQLYEQSPEADMLRQMRDQLVPKLPLSQRAELKKRLAEALEAENYELAAILRDELKQLKD
ncbi:MAG: UvrB/UvrC motif-containing protein [Planctomycetes bacterium]|nr:UvrB/UvrC motif-containing protein [Planctomycetota bacterium]